MKNALIICLIVIFPNLGQAQTINKSFTHNGVTRTYEIYIPVNYSGTTPVPLVFNFHGFGGSGSQQRGSTNFLPIADTAGFIIIHPTGTLLGPPLNFNHWNVGGWTAASPADDMGFTSAMIDSTATQYNIDLNRVYACGFSNGGFFSHKLAGQLSNRFAAIASVSGTFTPQMITNAAPTHPMPVLQIHGTTDPTVPYTGTTGNGGMSSVDDVIQYWVNYNNCDQTPTSTTLPDLSATDGSTVEHDVYANGDNGVSVELMRVVGGAHRWPGNPSANQDISASVEIWKFFSRYSNTPVSTQEFNKKTFSVYPNPTSSTIHVLGDLSQELDYALYSFQGRIVKQGTIDAAHSSIDLSDLASSVYVLRIGEEYVRILRR